jgi:hypothetical protein
VVSHDDLFLNFHKTSEQFHTLMREQVASLGLEAEGMTSAKVGPGGITPVLANVFQMGRVGVDGELLCHYVTPASAVAKQRGEGELQLMPVVNLQMPITLMLGLLNYIQSRTEELEAFTRRLYPEMEL